jgi:orotidine-5'-phosphate decarboxylase
LIARPKLRSERIGRRLIVALDLSSVDDARALVGKIGSAASFYKIGYQLAYAGGLSFAEELIDAGKRVFFDFKLHDIPNTVEEGVRSLARLSATFLTVHAYPQTMQAAVAGRADSDLNLLAVTVLTSYNDADAAAAGYAGPVADLVAARSAQARDIGVDGIVCAAPEAGRVRAIVGSARLIVTPGIRPVGDARSDQKRVVTPAEALRAGADYIVVGRPITAAADPRQAAEAIIEEMGEVDAH